VCVCVCTHLSFYPSVSLSFVKDLIELKVNYDSDLRERKPPGETGRLNSEKNEGNELLPSCVYPTTPRQLS